MGASRWERTLVPEQGAPFEERNCRSRVMVGPGPAASAAAGKCGRQPPEAARPPPSSDRLRTLDSGYSEERRAPLLHGDASVLLAMARTLTAGRRLVRPQSESLQVDRYNVRCLEGDKMLAEG